jgi:hypothetical protein
MRVFIITCQFLENWRAWTQTMPPREISATINIKCSRSFFVLSLVIPLTVQLTLKSWFFILRYSFEFLAWFIGTFSKPYITDKRGNTLITLTGSGLAIKVLRSSLQYSQLLW